MYNPTGIVQDRKVFHNELYKCIQNDPVCDKALCYYRHLLSGMRFG
jgi:hypothetical protein